jgi:hypothetical protein
VKNILGKKAEREGEGERVMEARRKWLRRQGGSETGGGGRGCHAQGGDEKSVQSCYTYAQFPQAKFPKRKDKYSQLRSCVGATDART